MTKKWNGRIRPQALYALYEQRKQSFLALNTPTSDEYEAFCRALAKELGV